MKKFKNIIYYLLWSANLINFLMETDSKTDNFLNKLFKDLNLVCLDFSKKNTHILNINSINIPSKNNRKRIFLKKEIKIKIKKNDTSEFLIIQDELNITIQNNDLRKGIICFQKSIFDLYQKIKKKTNLKSYDYKVKSFLDEIF